MLILAPLAGWAGDPAMDPDRPNILWLVSEDNSEWYVGPYGNPLARTPNIDKLADGGIVFRTAYASAPVCAAARSSIITGCLASSMGTENMRSQRPLPPGVRFFPEYLREAGYYCSNKSKTDYNTSDIWSGAWDESSVEAHWRKRAPGQPFFSVFNFNDSHESKLFQHLPLETDPAQVRVPAYLPDVPAVRRDIAQYFDLLAKVDAQIGDVLRQLEEDGLGDDTIIFYYGDHGGALPRQKRFLYRSGCQIPLVAHFPEKYAHLAPESVDGWNSELVNFIDLAPTVLSLAGIPVPGYMQGRAIAGKQRKQGPEYSYSFRARMDERLDLSRSVTDGKYWYVRNYRPELPHGRKVEYMWRSAAMQAWQRLYRAGKLEPAQEVFFQPKAVEELFDSQADPDNAVNLAGKAEYAGVLERMRGALRERMLELNDPGLMMEAMLEAIDDTASPAVLARDTSLYPLPELLELVDRIQCGKATAGEVKACLERENPLFRYWATAALATGGQEVDLHATLADPHPVVRLMAAETILRTQDATDTAAWEVIENSLQDPGLVHRCIMAANVVADLKEAPDSVVEALGSLQFPDTSPYGHYVGRLADDRANLFED